MTNIGVLMAGSSRENDAHEDHFYATPEEPIVALIRHYPTFLNDTVIWECACGDGAMSNVLVRETNSEVVSSDIIHRSLLIGEKHDFLGDGGIVNVPIVTNPPFKYAVQFIRKAHELGSPFIAMFLKQNFWNTRNRLDLWDDHPPKACHPLSWRVDFSGQGNPTMDCQWCVWGDDVPFSNQPFRKSK